MSLASQSQQVPNHDEELLQICKQLQFYDPNYINQRTLLAPENSSRRTQKQDSPTIYESGKSEAFLGCIKQKSGNNNQKTSRRARCQLHKKINLLPVRENESIPTTKLTNQISCSRPQRLIFIQSFRIREKADGAKFFVAQAQNWMVYIGCLVNSSQFQIIRRVIIDSPIVNIFYSGYVATENLHQDKLLLGCRNGKVFIMDNCTYMLNSASEFQVEGSYFECFGENIQDMHFVPDPNDNTHFYLVLDGSRLQRYHCEPQRSIDAINQENNKNSQIITQQKIKIIRNICVNSQNCLLIYLEGMSIPCILAPAELNRWFPARLDELASLHNIFVHCLSSGLSLRPLGGAKSSQAFIQIEGVEYETASNTLVIGRRQGILQFCSIVQSIQIMDQQQFEYFEGCPFSYFVEVHYAIKKGNKISSFSIKQDSPYVCVATDERVIFFDFQKRMKFSETLKQKEQNPINKVEWSCTDNLLLCSLTCSESRAYLYSKLLPIGPKVDPL